MKIKEQRGGKETSHRAMNLLAVQCVLAGAVVLLVLLVRLVSRTVFEELSDSFERAVSDESLLQTVMTLSNGETQST